MIPSSYEKTLFLRLLKTLAHLLIKLSLHLLVLHTLSLNGHLFRRLTVSRLSLKGIRWCRMSERLFTMLAKSFFYTGLSFFHEEW